MSSIVLSVDAANSGSPTNETFVLTSPSEGKSSYILAGTTLQDRTELTLYGTRPKRAGNFRGVIRSGIKFNLAVEVDGVDATDSIDSDAIVNVQFSIPVGTATADIVHIRQRVIALLDDDTLMAKLNETAITLPNL